MVVGIGCAKLVKDTGLSVDSFEDLNDVTLNFVEWRRTMKKTTAMRKILADEQIDEQS